MFHIKILHAFKLNWEKGKAKVFNHEEREKKKKEHSDHLQMLIVLIITKDKSNCSLAGMTWLFLAKLADLPL